MAMKEDNNTNKIFLSRRKFIGKSALALTGIAIASNSAIGAPAIIRNLGKPNSKFNGVQIGAITYSWRSMPVDADSIIRYCVDCNVSALELMGNTAEEFAGAPYANTQPGARERLSGDERAERARQIAAWRASVSMKPFEELRKKFQKAGIGIYAYKPSALGESNSDAEIEYALRAAKALGASHVTVELQKNAEQSQRLGLLANRHKIAVAYHGHLQQTFTAWDLALSQAKFNGINLDAGHYVAAGFDPLAFIEAKHANIYSMHVKDRQSLDNGQANLPWGEGDTPIAEILQLMHRNKYKFPATVELEYNIPQGSDAVKEVARCVEFCRKALG